MRPRLVDRDAFVAGQLAQQHRLLRQHVDGQVAACSAATAALHVAGPGVRCQQLVDAVVDAQLQRVGYVPGRVRGHALGLANVVVEAFQGPAPLRRTHALDGAVQVSVV